MLDVSQDLRTVCCADVRAREQALAEQRLLRCERIDGREQAIVERLLLRNGWTLRSHLVGACTSFRAIDGRDELAHVIAPSRTEVPDRFGEQVIRQVTRDAIANDPELRGRERLEDRFEALKHANVETAALLDIKQGDGRLGVFINEEVDFKKPPTISTDARGRQTIEGYTSRVDRPGEFVVVVSAGRADQAPSMVSDLMLQTTREGGTVRYELDFDDDEQFTGYTVVLAPKSGSVRRIKITGAASRSFPRDAMKAQGDIDEKVMSRAERACGLGTDSTDVPASSGEFPGGFTGSSVQGSRTAVRDNNRDRTSNAKQE